MLIILGGLSGVSKTTIACEIAKDNVRLGNTMITDSVNSCSAWFDNTHSHRTT